jgi:predicted RNase H-like HicB family nuclease
MERIATSHIEKLPDGVYLATSDDIPGLIAQGRTIAQTLEIARDVAKKLIEMDQSGANASLSDPGDTFDFPLIVAA